MDLSEIETGAWNALEKAAGNPEAALRYLTLCSVDRAMRPQARTVVLRRVDALSRKLAFHTDTRSPKWAEFSENPNATVLGYDADIRIQLRFTGTVTLSGPGTSLAKVAWDALPPWTRSTYAGGPPGDEAAFAGEHADPAPEAVEDGPGRDRFGVITFRAASLDWFRLARQDNRRAVFLYDTDGVLTSARRVNP